jgi:hypothetical protein
VGAARRGGGGYALVTHLELRLDRVPELFGGQVVWPAAAAPGVLGAWRGWTAGLPPEMSSSAGVISLPPLPEVREPLRVARVAGVTACLAGPAGRGAAMLGELTARTSAPMVNACRPLTPAAARKIVSRWKKSQASKPSACVRSNARQGVSAFRGAGLRRPARRIRRTVAWLMR